MMTVRNPKTLIISKYFQLVMPWGIYACYKKCFWSTKRKERLINLNIIIWCRNLL